MITFFSIIVLWPIKQFFPILTFFPTNTFFPNFTFFLNEVFFISSDVTSKSSVTECIKACVADKGTSLTGGEYRGNACHCNTDPMLIGNAVLKFSISEHYVTFAVKFECPNVAADNTDAVFVSEKSAGGAMGLWCNGRVQQHRAGKYARNATLLESMETVRRAMPRNSARNSAQFGAIL